MNDLLQARQADGVTRVNRAARIGGAGSAAVVDTVVPDPAAGQVRIRLEGCGVCGSNLPVWEGRDWFSYPLAPGAPGHEGWGHVDAVGDGVMGLAVGDRVAALSQHAFAEYDLADAAAVVTLPACFDDRPFPGEPIGCAMNVFRRSAIEPGQHVAVVGVGFMGALLIQLAVRAGAHVIAVSRRPFALEIARACGAEHTVRLDADAETVVARVRTLTDGALCDRVIEAAGIQATLALAGQLVRERGRLVIAGFHQDGTREVDMFLWNWRGIDVINAHERDSAVYARGMREAVTAVAAGTIDPALLYTHEYPLDRLDVAFDDLRRRPAGFLKGLVRT
jgi:threonine dehydrogenase-like Zn-dependent dehydrogenase